MKRAIVLGVVVAAGYACVALAATITVSTAKVGANSAAVSACDTNGFTYTYPTSRGQISAVTVGGIADPGCEGGTLNLTLTDSSGTSIGGGTQTVPTDGDTSPNSMSVSTSPRPSASATTTIHVSIVGP